MNAPLKIYVQYDADSEDYQLVCTDGKMAPAPCGPRIFRGPPHPIVKFRHDTLKGAELDADLIRHYLANLSPKKISKKEIQQTPA